MHDIVMPAETAIVHTISWWTPGKPVQWSRAHPRGGGSPYSPKSVVVGQSRIRESLEGHLLKHPALGKVLPWEGPVSLSVVNLYAPPKKDSLGRGFRRRPKMGTPDASNLLKQPEDALEFREGSASLYMDDRQITDTYSCKRYHPYLEGVLITAQLRDDTEILIPWEHTGIRFDRHGEGKPRGTGYVFGVD